MIQRINTAILGMLLVSGLYAQKPPIDSTTFNEWSRLSGEGISNNGRYIYYKVSYKANSRSQDDLFIGSTDKRWERSFPNTKSPALTQDSRQAIFQRQDTIFQVGLGNDEIKYIDGLEGDYSLLRNSNDEDVLVYRVKKEPGILYTKVVSSGDIKSYASVEKYWYNAMSGMFLMLVKDANQPGSTYHLIRTNPTLKKLTDIWRGSKVENLVFNSDGTKLAFIAAGDQDRQSLWYYDLQKEKVTNLLREDAHVIDEDFKITSILGISKGNTKVYLTITKVNNKKFVSVPGVDVYRYNDPKLQSQQLIELKNHYPSPFKAIVNISNSHFVQLEQEDEEVIGLRGSTIFPDNWILLIKKGPGDTEHEWFWNKKAQTSLYLLSLNDGSRQLLGENMQYDAPNSLRYQVSPDEKYVLFFDRDKLNYYSLNIATGVRKNITGNIHARWAPQNSDVYRAEQGYPFGRGAFVKDGSVLIYDEHDIYKVDMEAKAPPVNLTASFGKTHQIRFRVFPYEIGSYSNKGLDPNKDYGINERIILRGFDENNKDQGLYNAILNKSNRMDSIAMVPMTPWGLIKARDKNAYIIELSSEKSSANIFFSADFDLTKFTPLSDIHPEFRYNWLTSELITWQLPDGRKSQGILYKPEDFDPHKKYPVIFNYYHDMSDQLHSYLTPGFTSGSINVPFFVSNGYLVFLPDIHYTMGIPGRSALNAVVSAADVLAKRPYVDATKMALQGMSFGGFETNYIVAHTTRFAAAMSNSGMSNLVSLYGSLILGDGVSRARQFEVEHDRVGGSLWEMPEKYIENSPVLRADKITTPLLMVANIDDYDVTRAQGVELFTALRRLGKKAWMLQYDLAVGGTHGVSKPGAGDFTIRIFQFFNYYLKNAPAPKWMTQGVPASEKGLFTGLELDQSGTKP